MPLIRTEPIRIQRQRLAAERIPSAWTKELEALRPKTRDDCRNNGIRPCPFLSCKHNLQLEITKAHRLRVISGLTESCAADVAERHLGDGVSQDEVAAYLAVTRKRISQIERPALATMKERMKEESSDEEEETDS